MNKKGEKMKIKVLFLVFVMLMTAVSFVFSQSQEFNSELALEQTLFTIEKLYEEENLEVFSEYVSVNFMPVSAVEFISRVERDFDDYSDIDIDLVIDTFVKEEKTTTVYTHWHLRWFSQAAGADQERMGRTQFTFESNKKQPKLIYYKGDTLFGFSS